MSFETKNEQQRNRLSALPNDTAVSLEYVKALVEAQTGRPVKAVRPMQIFGRSADFTGDNRMFYALDLTILPVADDQTNGDGSEESEDPEEPEEPEPIETRFSSESVTESTLLSFAKEFTITGEPGSIVRLKYTVPNYGFESLMKRDGYTMNENDEFDLSLDGSGDISFIGRLTWHQGVFGHVTGRYSIVSTSIGVLSNSNLSVDMDKVINEYPDTFFSDFQLLNDDTSISKAYYSLRLNGAPGSNVVLRDDILARSLGSSHLQTIPLYNWVDGEQAPRTIPETGYLDMELNLIYGGQTTDINFSIVSTSLGKVDGLSTVNLSKKYCYLVTGLTVTTTLTDITATWNNVPGSLFTAFLINNDTNVSIRSVADFTGNNVRFEKAPTGIPPGNYRVEVVNHCSNGANSGVAVSSIFPFDGLVHLSFDVQPSYSNSGVTAYVMENAPNSGIYVIPLGQVPAYNQLTGQTTGTTTFAPQTCSISCQTGNTAGPLWIVFKDGTVYPGNRFSNVCTWTQLNFNQDFKITDKQP